MRNPVKKQQDPAAPAEIVVEGQADQEPRITIPSERKEEDNKGSLGFVRVTYVDENGTILELAQLGVESEIELPRVAKKCAGRLEELIVRRGVEAARNG